MVNIKRYLSKHARSARDVGIQTAARNAAQEAATFAYSQYLNRQDRGDYIWESDAPISVILDATRYDLWNETTRDVDGIPFDYAGWSVGSCSPEWIGNTFDPAVMPAGESVGVVTANPFSMKPPERVEVLQNTPLHENPAVDECHYVFQDSWGCDVDGEHLDVTHPDVVTNAAYDAWREWDVDRLVVHYMQPHTPFRSRPEWFGERANLQHFGEPDAEVNKAYKDENKELWFRLRDGELERADVWAAYRDNLRWGLNSVKRLVDAVDVDVLLTADHGNALGEWGVWAHPPRMQLPAVRKVPWVGVSGGGGEFDRVEVAESRADVGVDDQLRALGYK